MKWKKGVLLKKEIELMGSNLSLVKCLPLWGSPIEEVVRVLKPKGLFILTIDLDLCGYKDIGIRRYYDLRQCLVEYFDPKEPEVTVHPLDVLQPRNGPFPYMTYSTWQKWKFHVKQRIKPLFGKKPFYALPNLAVWGAVMTKEARCRDQQIILTFCKYEKDPIIF